MIALVVLSSSVHRLQYPSVRLSVSKWAKRATEAVRSREVDVQREKQRLAVRTGRAVELLRPAARVLAEEFAKKSASSIRSELPEVLSHEEACELLKISKNSLYDGAGRGEIPHRRLGNRLLFSRAALMTWLGGH